MPEGVEAILDAPGRRAEEGVPQVGLGEEVEAEAGADAFVEVEEAAVALALEVPELADEARTRLLPAAAPELVLPTPALGDDPNVDPTLLPTPLPAALGDATPPGPRPEADPSALLSLPLSVRPESWIPGPEFLPRELVPAVSVDDRLAEGASPCAKGL